MNEVITRMSNQPQVQLYLSFDSIVVLVSRFDIKDEPTVLWFCGRKQQKTNIICPKLIVYNIQYDPKALAIICCLDILDFLFIYGIFPTLFPSFTKMETSPYYCPASQE